MKKIRVIVASIFPGLLFRIITDCQAKKLGVKIHVRELRDTDREIIAEGESKAVDELLKWIKSYPILAVVKYQEGKVTANSKLDFFKARPNNNSFTTTEYIEFTDKSGKTFIANSGEEFIKIFIHFDNNFLKYGLETGAFQDWLQQIGEKDLFNLISDVKAHKKPKYWIRTIRKRLRAIKYFQVIDIEKAIEIKLKEYEALRAEILFHMQNRTQIILLGLTGIFAIAGLALAPLTDFFTTENITLPIKDKITINRTIDAKPEKSTTPLKLIIKQLFQVWLF